MIVSYAQNLEDVILYRVFKNIQNGIYIDVGANDPIIDSCTLLFYEKGWHGINIEPVREHYDALNYQRTRDININGVISPLSGEINLYSPETRGHSTISKERFQDFINNNITVEVLKTNCFTLNDLINKYIGNSDIHFLKIDVEGAEYQVLETINLKLYRPWVILCESLELTADKSCDEFVELLKKFNYEYCYNDGINKYFIRSENIYLKKYFNSPPNIFDNYIRYKELEFQRNAHNKIHDLTVINSQMDKEIVSLNYIIDQNKNIILNLNNELDIKNNQILFFENSFPNKFIKMIKILIKSIILKNEKKK